MLSISSNKRIFAATLITALLLLLTLEVRSPYYFLQDDSLESYLPMYFHNWRSLLAGELPLYDFHIFCGVPHASMGQEAPFYLPEYLCLFLSQSIWRHPFAAIDLMAILHALLAVAGTFMLLRHLGVKDTVASFGALTALSAFFVWCGQMWITATMLCAWFPWMVLAALRCIVRPSYGRAAWLMFFRLGLLFGGHSQFVVLAMIFEHFFALMYARAIQPKCWLNRFVRYLAWDLPTGLMGLPLILPLSAEVQRSLLRSAPFSYEMFSVFTMDSLRWLFGQLFVFIQITPSLKDDIGGSLPYLSHIGYITTILSCCAYGLWSKRSRNSSLIAACAVCFFGALLWTWNLLGPLLYHVAILNRFRAPFKLVYFAGFFQCLLAALALEHWNKKWQRIALAAFVVNWLVVFCVLPDHAWRLRKYQLPLQSPWQAKLGNGRYLVIGPTPTFAHFQQYIESNYALMWGLDNLRGYEPMLSRIGARVALLRPEEENGTDLHSGTYYGSLDQSLFDHIKQWSVRYVLVSPDPTTEIKFNPTGNHRWTIHTSLVSPDISAISANLALAGFQWRETRGGWMLWEDPNFLPRVRWNQGSTAGISWVEHVNSIEIFLSEWPSQHLTLAVTANPGLQSCIENRCEPISSSADGMVHIDVPPGTAHVRLMYRNALLVLSSYIAFGTLVLFVLLWWYSQRRCRWYTPASPPGIRDECDVLSTP
jgi:hypothetical protein